jgi:MFS family permease
MRMARNVSFRWLWTATSSGALGEGISWSVLPLVMASLTRNPLLVALLQTGAALPCALFGLQAGALADRWDRARVLVLAEVARAALAAVLVLLILLGLVHVTSLLFLAFATSVATVMFRAADSALLPSLVTSAELSQANARLKASGTIMGSFVGPGPSAPHLSPTVSFSPPTQLEACSAPPSPRPRIPASGHA